MNEQGIRAVLTSDFASQLSAANILIERHQQNMLQRMDIELFLIARDPLKKFINEKYKAYMESRGMTP